MWHDEPLPAGDTRWLGATPDTARGGTSFAFYTASAATDVELCFFDKADGPCKEEHYRLESKEPVKNDSGQTIGYIWNGFAKGIEEGALYGFRVNGPYEPGKGHFFNPNKLLVDPCARAVTGEIHTWEKRHYPVNNDNNADVMPKARVVNWQALQSETPSKGLLRPHGETGNILELHVKGATILNEDIPERFRGTYKALSAPAFIDWVKSMGFTSLELMPVESFGTDPPLADRGKRNYWGYMTMTPTAPHTGYAATDKPEVEFAEAVRALRKAGIEVIMDVVPNHTIEGNHNGPMINLRGMDSRLYLHDRDYTGTGNTRDFGHPINRRLFLEELKYWKSIGVSGFRIDLATVIGREGGKAFNPDSPMMQAIRHDPDLKDVKFYGEPWDLGEFALGRLAHAPEAPVGSETNPIAEWDGRARDVLEQAAFNHDIELSRGEIIHAIAGSSSVYTIPLHRVIKIGSHDGATLYDRTAFEHKHNEPNGEGNRDGNNLSAASYWANADDRQRVQRFAIATLALSQGTHMMTLGHDRCQTQGGNTNPYCQDNGITHILWKDRVSPEGTQLMEFTRSANRFHLAHPSLRRGLAFTGQADTESGLTFNDNTLKDVTWLSPEGHELQGEQMHQHGGFAMLLSGDPGNNAHHNFGTSRTVERSERDIPLLALVNPTKQNITFHLPDVPGVKWVQKLNRETAASSDFAVDGNEVKVGWRSVAVFEGQLVREQSLACDRGRREIPKADVPAFS